MEKTAERNNLALPDKFVLYSGMRNPSDPNQVSWMVYENYNTKTKAQIAMRQQHQKSGGLWLVVRETPICGMLPDGAKPHYAEPVG